MAVHQTIARIYPILLTLDNPAALDQEPKVAPRVYGLGADVSGRNL
jgi:hypothetical protein